MSFLNGVFVGEMTTHDEFAAAKASNGQIDQIIPMLRASTDWRCSRNQPASIKTHRSGHVVSFAVV
jgi:hypothetical protein